jgi:hypothetical protein
MFPLTRPARKRRTPSSRNLEIYEAVMLQGRTQEDVAAEFDLSQGRISQILASVEGWRASTAAAERGELTPEERQRSEQWLARRRNDELYRRNLRAFDASDQPLKTVKTIEEPSTDDGESSAGGGVAVFCEAKHGSTEHAPDPSVVCCANHSHPDAGSDSPTTSSPAVVDRRLKTLRIETTVREQRANASFLRQAFAANKELMRIAELKPLQEPKPEENYQKEHAAVDDWLWRQRRKREDEGQVAKSAHPGCLVTNWLAVLLGDTPGAFSPGFAPPGAAVKEMVRRFVLQRYQVIGDQPGGEGLVEEVLGEPIGTNHPAYPGEEYPFPVVPEEDEGRDQESVVSSQEPVATSVPGSSLGPHYPEAPASAGREGRVGSAHHGAQKTVGAAHTATTNIDRPKPRSLSQILPEGYYRKHPFISIVDEAPLPRPDDPLPDWKIEDNRRRMQEYLKALKGTFTPAEPE